MGVLWVWGTHWGGQKWGHQPCVGFTEDEKRCASCFPIERPVAWLCPKEFPISPSGASREHLLVPFFPIFVPFHLLSVCLRGALMSAPISHSLWRLLVGMLPWNWGCGSNWRLGGSVVAPQLWGKEIILLPAGTAEMGFFYPLLETPMKSLCSCCSLFQTF